MDDKADLSSVAPNKGSAVSRRAVLGGVAGLTTTSVVGQPRKTPDRPNILWLVSEDNNPFIGAYGDRLARTPTIDALAAGGVLYRHCYSTAPVCAPSRFTILTGIPAESCAPANQMRAAAQLPDGFRTYPELMRTAGYFCTNNAKTDYNSDVDPKAIWDLQGTEGHWRKRTAGKPFLAVFNYETTHESRIFQPTAGRVTPEMVQVPPYLPDTPGIRGDFASYYNLMEKIDGQLAARLAELKADGLEDDTIVFYYSDNGGVLPRSKRYCYDEGLRCALVVYAPPKWRHLLPAAPGGEVRTPVTLMDLPSTILALAGVSQPAQMQGKPLLGRQARPQKYAFGMRNRMDERIDFIRTVTDGRWRYIRNYMPHRPWGQYQAFEWLAKGYQDWEAEYRAGRLNPVQARFFQPKPYEELYDLSADPHEIRNLADTKEAHAKLAEMRRALDEHMLAVNDNGFIPEGMAGEGYFASRDPKVYPLADLMEVGALAAQGAPASLPRLRAALSNPAPSIRFWAATGLLILGRNALPALEELRGVMRGDPSPHVRVVAAEAVAKLGPADEAVTVLARLLDQAATWQVQLYAINALTFIGDPARAALPSIRKAAESEQEYLRSAGGYLVAILTGIYSPFKPIFDLERMMRRAMQAGAS